jgi:hypothetical protein
MRSAALQRAGARGEKRDGVIDRYRLGVTSRCERRGRRESLGPVRVRVKRIRTLIV